ncbi:MAG: winged-helix domain-containing protein, partial [Anaerolineae bacterium]
MEQRWVTLRLLLLALVREHEAFIRDGPRHLKPLTRAQLADSLGLHESIVSRAVANKYVQLPNSRIVPMSIFFDDSLPVKEVIREIIAQEEEPLSDQEIAAELARRGYQVARRTVAKYRDALGILPAALRFRGRARQGASATGRGGGRGG